MQAHDFEGIGGIPNPRYGAKLECPICGTGEMGLQFREIDGIEIMEEVVF